MVDYRVDDEQLIRLVKIAGTIVANWNQRDEILNILGVVADQKLPSGEPSQMFGRWR
jgi:hypothetical protein